MNKTLSTDQIMLNIVVNGDAAKNELGQLDRRAVNLTQRMKELKRGTKEYAKTSKELRQVNDRMNELRQQVGFASLSMRQLRQRAKELSILKTHLTPGTVEFKKVNKELQLVNTRLAQLTSQSAASGNSLAKYARTLNGYWIAITAAIAGLAAAVMGLRRAITEFAEFDDKVADAMKVTRLTREEIYALNEQFKKIDTRVAQEELMDLAWVAGKLGLKGSEDVLSFVNAAQKINVALKKDLGGNAETALREIGKLVDVFNLTHEYGIEESMLKVGSVINELGMASTATEGYLINFTKRAAGIAPTANVSISHVLGLAATLDRLGQQAETSSTVYTMIMANMHKKTEEFARVAGRSLEDFTKILNEDANEAMIAVLEGLSGSESMMGEMVENLIDVGMEGRRATAVMGVLANSTHILRTQQALANDAFEKGTSIQNEYNIKNNTSMAMLEKRRKSLANMRKELGERLLPIMAFSTKSMTYFIKALVETLRFFDENKKEIIAISLSLATYAATVKLAALATFLLSKATWQAFRAKLALMSLSKLNPWGLGLAAIVALVTWIRRYREELNSVTAAERALQEVRKEADRSAQDEILKLNTLINRIKNLNVHNTDRVDLIRQLNTEYGHMLNNLLLEQSTVHQIDTAYKQLTESIKAHAMEKALASAREDQFRKLGELYIKQEERLAKYKRQTGKDEYNPYRTQEIIQEDGTAKMTFNPFKAFPIKHTEDQLEWVARDIKNALDLFTKLDEEYEAFYQKLEAERKSRIKNFNEAQADALEGDTIDELNRKLNLYRQALEYLEINGEDYNRVQLKIRDVQKQLIALFTEESTPATEEAINAYDELGKKIGFASSQLAHYVTLGDLTSAQSWNKILKGLQGQKYVLDELIEAGGNMEVMLQNLQKKQHDLYTPLMNANIKAIDADIDRTFAEDNRFLDSQAKKETNKTAQDRIDAETRRVREILQLEKDWHDATIDIAYSVSNATADILRDRLNYETDLKLAHLAKQRDAELSNVHLTNEQREKIEEKYRLKEAKIRADAFRKQKAADIIMSIINTGVAITRALAAPPGYPLNKPSVIAAGIAGAAQTAVIAATKVPQFVRGRYSVIGKDDNKQYNVPFLGDAKTGVVRNPALIAERGDELIIDHPTLNNLRVNFPEVIRAIHNSRVPQYSEGRMPDASSSAVRDKERFDSSASISLHTDLLNAVNRLSALLKKLNDNGIEATILYQKIKDIQDKDKRIQKKSNF